MLLQKCGDNLPLVDASFELLVERIRFAALKLSQGDFAALERHVKAANRDWRDVLMAAGFANSVEAHTEWHP